MFVVRCFVVCLLLFVVVRCLLLVVCCFFCCVCGSLLVVGCLVFVDLYRMLLAVVIYVLFAVCC